VVFGGLGSCLPACYFDTLHCWLLQPCDSGRIVPLKEPRTRDLQQIMMAQRNTSHVKYQDLLVCMVSLVSLSTQTLNRAASLW
jgi:hypothetical protein